MTAPQLQAARVRVPCSTSNLGSGFDVLGLALNSYLEASFEPGGNALELQRTGTLSGLDEGPEQDFLVSAFQQVMASHGVEARGLIRATSQTPLARGLGSSAMALVAGAALARAALGQDPSPDAAFDAARGHEGHGDNAAPCAFGGLRAVIPGEDGPRVLALPLSSEVGFAYAAPATRVSTDAARGALPSHVAHPTAVLGRGRFAGLLHGLATGDPELIRIGFTDELHVPYRLPLIPGAHNAMGVGYDAGAWGVTISGSGSGLIALCPPEKSEAVAAAMHEVFCAGGDEADCWGMALQPDFEGLAVMDRMKLADFGSK